MPLKAQEGSATPKSAQWRWKYPSKNFKLSLSIVFVCQQVLTFAHDLTVVGFSFIGTMEKAQAQNESIMLDTITFDQLPQAVSHILDGITEIKSICEELRENSSGKDTYMTVEELCAYHPDHPSHQTVRRWKRLGYIPFYKDDETRRVKFKKSEIDAWIASSRHMSREEQVALRNAKILAQRRQMEIGGLDDDDE